MVNARRTGIAVLTGALLGVLCIIGVGARIPGNYLNLIYLTGVWYNRVIMGLVVGLAGGITLIKSDKTKNYPNAVVRGLIIGIVVSSATLLMVTDTAGWIIDLLGWFAGIMYGLIIDLVATATEK